ncbi:hypothetical protein ACLI4Z_06005 [Natrialbaceae archaeon A-arb3/5]
MDTRVAVDGTVADEFGNGAALGRFRARSRIVADAVESEGIE